MIWPYNLAMSRPPINEIMTSLRMPLRDAAKTLRAASAASESPLRDIAHVLPIPVREMIKQSVRQADEIGSQLFERGLPNRTQILQARDTLMGASAGLEGQPNFVRVLTFAMSEGLRRLDQEDWVVSHVRLSMIAADKLASQTEVSITARAALMTQAILSSHAVFTFEDLVPRRGAALSDANQLATFAAFLWLCVERDTEQDEALLLQLCMDVGLSSQGDLEQAMSSQESLTALYDRLSRVI